MSAVLLTATAEGERLALVATGSWTAERAAELEKIIDETARRYPGARSVESISPGWSDWTLSAPG